MKIKTTWGEFWDLELFGLKNPYLSMGGEATVSYNHLASDKATGI
jgi:hypothetical protein